MYLYSTWVFPFYATLHFYSATFQREILQIFPHSQSYNYFSDYNYTLHKNIYKTVLQSMINWCRLTTAYRYNWLQLDQFQH